jgi:hypothetical protein
MAVDVTKAISANAFKNGYVVLNPPRASTNAQEIAPPVANAGQDPSTLASKYDARFDDPTYYTA